MQLLENRLLDVSPAFREGAHLYHQSSSDHRVCPESTRSRDCSLMACIAEFTPAAATAASGSSSSKRQQQQQAAAAAANNARAGRVRERSHVHARVAPVGLKPLRERPSDFLVIPPNSGQSV